MGIEFKVLVYTIGILAEVALYFPRQKFYLFIPVIVSCLLFLITREATWFYLSLIDAFIAVVGCTIQQIILSRNKKKQMSDVEKSKIKDL